jgi:integrase
LLLGRKAASAGANPAFSPGAGFLFFGLSTLLINSQPRLVKITPLRLRHSRIRFKKPKTKAGRRDITLPDLLVDTLRDFRKAQLELRVELGSGKLTADTLLFVGINGALPSQKYYSKAWSDFANQIGMPDLDFHGLRHTHADQLIDAGVDIVTISKRLGHSKPDITLRIYAHLFRKDDSKAAAAINAVLNR